MTTPAPDGPARTAILTVDDDPGVSRSIARDLRQRYAEQHRIVRAESGADALDALKEMRLRGDEVAVILADYRMPQMNGIEFLEAAMNVYPAARRVLLTAYADTDAAIEAINVVDLDYYLLKPWDPPEEKLYPVIDAQLEAWRQEDYQPVHVTKVVGHRWSARCTEVREFLARNEVAYRWFPSDEPDGERLLAAAGADGRTLPLVITPDGETMIAPSDSDLATRVGLTTTPAKDFYDLVVIGGGPAGLGAAVYGASEGLKTVLVERTATGGQAGQSSRIENYLGFPDGVSGAQLTTRARRQALRFGAEVLTTREVVGLEVKGAAREVQFADGGTLGAHSVILATGVSYKQLGAPGLKEMTGRGVYYGSALTEASACIDQDIYIVGGANSAGQAAVYLARHAKSVTLLVRGPSLERSMSYYLIQQLGEVENITVRTCTEVIGAGGDGHLEQLTLRNTSGRRHRNSGRADAVPIHRRRPADRLAGRHGRPRRPRFRRGRPGSVRGRPEAGRLAAGPGAVPPRDEHPGRVRGRGRPRRVRQAGRLRGRRRSHGRHARAPLSGEALAMSAEPATQPTAPAPAEQLAEGRQTLPCDADELRSLFLFEKLDGEQLAWLCREGRVELFPPGPVYAEGEPATCFYVLIEGTLVMSRRIGGDDVEVNRSSQRGACTPARSGPTWATGCPRCTTTRCGSPSRPGSTCWTRTSSRR